MAQYATSFDKPGGYSFDEASIRDLWTQVRRFVGKEAQIEISLEGDQQVVVRDPGELFDDEFVRRNFIEQISIAGSRYENERLKRVSVSLRNRSYRSAIGVSMSGEREECTARRVDIAA
jgi:hypothetical protein